MDFAFPDELGHLCANTETLPDASDDDFQIEPLRISLVQFPHHLLAGLQQIAAAYGTRVQFEQPEWSQPNNTLATMHMEADTMIYPMTMDPKFRTDTEMAPAPPTEHALWRVAFRYDPGLGASTVCRCSNFTNNRSKEIILAYGHVVQAFRGLGRLMTAAEAATRPNFNAEAELNFEERIQFDTLCFMLECSRNAVMRPSYLKVLLRVSALLGINAIMLYTEDTYQIKDEPFFGYLRGPYTESDLREFHAYATLFGIEVIPCIQTLGHLGQILQWPRFTHLRDTSEVILAHANETYALIDKMLTAATAGGPCRRIHIGMDESIGVGEGRHRLLFGDMDPKRIFTDHLERVARMCQAKGMTPLIWSDMLFTLATPQTSNPLAGAPSGDEVYSAVEDAILKSGQLAHTPAIPEGVQLVYWDYYHTSTEDYCRRIREHRSLNGGRVPWVATGIWNWNRLWTTLDFTMKSIEACMAACRAEGVRDVVVTTWGDDGNECDTMAILPGLHYFAEQGYSSTHEIDLKRLKYGFSAISGGSFDDWFEASKLDQIELIPVNNSTESKGAQYPGNMGKWLLWEDPVYSIYSPQHQMLNLSDHYRRLANRLSYVAKRNKYPLNSRLAFPAAIARVLSYKADLRARLVEAYHQALHSPAHGRSQLMSVIESRLRPLRRAVDDLWRYHRSMWLELNRAFGFEVMELRYGTLRTRLESLEERLLEYIRAGAGQCQPHLRIEELEVPLEQIHAEPIERLVLYYSNLASPSRNIGTG